MLAGIRRATLQGVKATAAVVDRVRVPRRGIVVLLYHRVGGRSGQELDLPLELFERQMEVLAGRHVVSLDEAVVRLAGSPGGAGGDRAPVVVTFDDGTADLVDVALPVLARHRTPATVYVATRFIEEGRDFPGSGQPVSWQGLRDAVSTGLVGVGSHTHSHALLDRLAPRQVEEELSRSVGLIDERLAVRADHFAYPKAVVARGPVEAIVRRTFVSAAVGGNRANVPGMTDLSRLARSPIQASDGMRWFAAKLDGGLALEETLRRNVNRARYARAEM